MSKRPGSGGERSRTVALVAVVLFALAGGLNLLVGEWLSAAFFLTGAFVFMRGREIERWPKAARVLLVLGLVALAVAMFVRLILRFKGRA